MAQPIIHSFFDSGLSSSKIVAFVGYGGVDRYDVNPYFRNKSDGFFKNTFAIWFRFNRGSGMKIIPIDDASITPDTKTILSKFKNAIVIDGDSEEYKQVMNLLVPSSPKISETRPMTIKYRPEYESIIKKSLAAHGAALSQFNNFKNRLGMNFRNEFLK